MAGSAISHAYLQENGMSAVVKIPMLQLRPMDEHDMPAVMEIENSVYVFPWSETIFQDCLRVGYCCWVMEWRTELVAYGVMSIGAGESHILNLCVSPQAQGMGFGRAMLDHLLEIARKHEADTAFLEVRPSNFSAIKLYMNAGFDEVGIRRNYYPAEYGREDALILARTLIE
jgi:ribosomal-protein-alanine N-acetyltransferase